LRASMGSGSATGASLIRASIACFIASGVSVMVARLSVLRGGTACVTRPGFEPGRACPLATVVEITASRGEVRAPGTSEYPDQASPHAPAVPGTPPEYHAAV